MLELDLPNRYKLPFHEFTDMAMDRCKRCIHFYGTVKFNDKFIKGNFCCHWEDMSDHRLDIIKQGVCESCVFERDKDSGHPYNALRLTGKNVGVLNLDGD